ncbi:hypothetical protein NDU88_002626 [Pleurodeles waltl]|uniref:Uncharacterized protein n=1 Tax=Pleurodeles waltl TaxID=8319 RepID=A0AAV7LD03_PLEWA|nr:hypothetical protein NDU88_002626 [Pleurodeles waltl]
MNGVDVASLRHSLPAGLLLCSLGSTDLGEALLGGLLGLVVGAGWTRSSSQLPQTPTLEYAITDYAVLSPRVGCLLQDASARPSRSTTSVLSADAPGRRCPLRVAARPPR